MKNPTKPSRFEDKTAVDQLLDVMAMLRDPKFGCPWDLQQSTKSLIAFTLEEVYEVVEAIDSEDIVEIEEELGDLLFQVVFYAQIAKEQKQFDFDAVAIAITDKLIRRHPHVFPEGKIENFGREVNISTDQVAQNWESIKKHERELKRQKKLAATHLGTSTCEQLNTLESLFDSVPVHMPALQRAEKLQSKAAREGFDWLTIAPVVAKLKEEIAEFELALEQGDSAAITDELGDVLFSAVNIARHAGVDAEASLRSSNNKFMNRVKWVELTLAAKNTSISQATSQELDQLWALAKGAGL
ncbi:MAG: ATP diphosphatase [Pseudohongiellaceae bacterium]|jgi:ATP diphosphatase